MASAQAHESKQLAHIANGAIMCSTTFISSLSQIFARPANRADNAVMLQFALSRKQPSASVRNAAEAAEMQTAASATSALINASRTAAASAAPAAAQADDIKHKPAAVASALGQPPQDSVSVASADVPAIGMNGKHDNAAVASASRQPSQDLVSAASTNVTAMGMVVGIADKQRIDEENRQLVDSMSPAEVSHSTD